MRALLLSCLAVASLAAAAPPPVFQIDPARSTVQFTITKLGFSDVTGVFRESSGEIRWIPSQPEASSIRWRVRVASLRTDAANRDRALQGHEYFDAARHPELAFESTRVRTLDSRTLEVTGNLTIRGVTRQQTLRVRHNASAAAPIFETDFDIDRYDFGIVGGTIMGRLIGRTARIHLRAVAEEHTL